MLKACLEDNTIFSKIIVAIAGIIDLVNLECREQGLTLRATDNLDVCMVSMHLHAGGFRLHLFEEECVLGLNVEFIAGSIRRFDERSSVEILCKVCDEHNDEVEFIFRSRDNHSLSSFNLLLMTIDDNT